MAGLTLDVMEMEIPKHVGIPGNTYTFGSYAMVHFKYGLEWYYGTIQYVYCVPYAQHAILIVLFFSHIHKYIKSYT